MAEAILEEAVGDDGEAEGDDRRGATGEEGLWVGEAAVRAGDGA